MTLNSPGRTPTSSPHGPAPKRRATASAQRFLFMVALFFACVGVTLVIAHLYVAALIALGVVVLAVTQLLAGVRRQPGRRERSADMGLSRLWRRRPGEPDPQTPRQYGHDGGEAGAHEETAPALRNSGAAAHAPVPVMESIPGPGTGIPARPDPSRQNTPGSPAEATPGERGYWLPDPPVFAGVSAPGQAPWHLPVGAVPSGLAADAARLGDLEVRAASVLGAGHRCEEPAGPRQDAYSLGRTPDGQFLVIAVADGVSQSPRSDLGARVAVTAATRELVKMLASGGMKAIDADLLYNIVVGEMLGTGRNRGLRDDDICSILIVTVIPTMPRPDGTRPLWASWIGDVSMWILRQGILHRVTGTEKEGLDRNALSAVLPFNPDRAEEITLELYPRDGVAVVTDGVSDSLSSLAGATEFFAREWSNPPPHPAVFLHSLCYDGPGQTDDRTAVVVWCGAGRQAGHGAHPGRPE